MTSSNRKGARLCDYGPPRWLGALQNAKPRTASTAGLLLSVFPSDLIILVTVGVNLAQNEASLLAEPPFIVLTILIPRGTRAGSEEGRLSR